MKFLCLLVSLCLASVTESKIEVSTCMDKVKVIKEAAKSEGCESLKPGRPDDEYDGNFINECLNKQFNYGNKDGSINVQKIIKSIQATAFDDKTDALVKALSDCNKSGAADVQPAEISVFMRCFAEAHDKICKPID